MSDSTTMNIKFKPVDYCGGKAYEFANNNDKEKMHKMVIALIPESIRKTRSFGFAQHKPYTIKSELAINELVIVKPDGDRNFLILTTIAGKKMAFCMYATFGNHATPVLVTVRLADEYFKKTTVFEGYLSESGTFSMTDILVNCGEDYTLYTRGLRDLARGIAIYRCHQSKQDLIKLTNTIYTMDGEFLASFLRKGTDIIRYKKDETRVAEGKLGFPVRMCSVEFMQQPEELRDAFLVSDSIDLTK